MPPLMVILFWIAGLAPVAGAFATPRFYSSDYAEFIMSGSQIDGSTALLLRLSVLVAAVSAGACLWQRRMVPFGRVGACGLAAVAFLTCALFSTVVNGDIPSGAAFIGPLIFLAAIGGNFPVTDVVRTVRPILLVHIYGSLAAAVLIPEWAIESDYAGAVLPVSLRLHGISNHANNLALLAMLLLIIDLSFSRTSRTLLQMLHRFSAALVLLLTQSKTIWVAAIALVFVLLTRWALRTRPADPMTAASRHATRLGAVVAAAALLVGCGLWLQRAIDDSVWTLTGRTTLWDLTISQWRGSPFIGLGEKFWAQEMRWQVLLSDGVVVAHAHNELLQTLGQAGALGVALLLLYLVTAARVVRASAGRARTAVLLCATLLLVRMATEPLLSSSFGTPNFLAHLLVFSLVCRSAPSIPSLAQAAAVRLRPRVV